MTRIDAVTGAQSVVAESLKLPVDVEITPDGSLLYVHERGLNWFGGAASGVRTVDMATGVSTRVFNAYRLNPMAGLAMDGTGRAFWETRNLRFSHTPADGVTELAGVDNRRSTITAPDGTMFYTRIGGPFGPCDSNNNVFLHVEETDQAGVPLGGRIFIAGGVDKVGFSDSTFADPLGRMCQTNLALTLAGSRIYINDAGNDAIRYLTYNP